VLVLERAETVGGGTRSAELTLEGFTHDVCSAIVPLALASPAFRDLDLARFGLEFAHPRFPFAHPLDGGAAVVVERSVDATAQRLGPDGPAYSRLMKKPLESAEMLIEDLLRPLRLPRHPFALARFGLQSLRSAKGLATSRFDGPGARALFAGVAAHSMLKLDQTPTAGFGLMLVLLAHATGWPAARGGSQRMADALTACLESLGGVVEVEHPVNSMQDLPPSGVALFDVTPRQLAAIAGDQLPERYVRRLARYRYGPGVFKVDWALDGPVPWTNEECSGAGTLHLGGTLEEIAESEDAIGEGRLPSRPYVLLAQQSMFDPTRAPAGRQTLWGYCHVPHGSEADMTEAIETQIERFAPGFRDRVLARHTMNAREIELYNPNYIGGDINGGIQDLRQHLARPVARAIPYSTPNPRIYICSSSTPPGGGVHGLGGFFAAKAALARRLKGGASGGVAVEERLPAD
jgi:phytoene dehydrogenase-like protein